MPSSRNWTKISLLSKITITRYKHLLDQPTLHHIIVKNRLYHHRWSSFSLKNAENSVMNTIHEYKRHFSIEIFFFHKILKLLGLTSLFFYEPFHQIQTFLLSHKDPSKIETTDLYRQLFTDLTSTRQFFGGAGGANNHGFLSFCLSSFNKLG